MSKSFKVRDKRNKGWFYLDNEYLNGCAKFFGPVGSAIYLSICRHADGDQKCFPSQQLIAEEFNISARTVIRHLRKLEKYSLIAIEKERKGGRWVNNVYYLLDKDEWDVPSDKLSHGRNTNQVTLSPSPSDNNDHNHVTQSHTKKTNRRKTHIRKESFLNTTKNKNIERIKKEIGESLRV